MPVILVNTPVSTKQPSNYTIWKTSLGWTGLVVTQDLVQFIFLSNIKNSVYQLIRNTTPEAQPDDKILPDLRQELTNYFQGRSADFHCRVDISWAGDFAQKILHSCLKTKPGEIISYCELARRAGYPNTARAAGSVMAKNRTPILIPCHRIIRSDGSPGRYSAGQGTATKQLLLELESVFANQKTETSCLLSPRNHQK